MIPTIKNKFVLRDDHIGIFDNYISEELIDCYLKYFHYAEEQGLTRPREPTPQGQRDIAVDHSIDMITSHFCNMSEIDLNYVNKPFLNEFFSKVYPIYAKKYSSLRYCERHTIYDMKVQKTVPGEGYHAWHIEHREIKTRNRLMAFMVYLNDVKEGGETEFLYQKCRFKPKRNTLLIWPTNYTHPHRGNPPLSNDKYILTGWVEYGI